MNTKVFTVVSFFFFCFNLFLLFTEETNRMEISREEFGPIMNVYKFSGENEVIITANNSELGLASGVFTKFVVIYYSFNEIERLQRLEALIVRDFENLKRSASIEEIK